MKPDDNTMTRAQKIVEGTRQNSESIGVSAAVVLSWVLTTYTPVSPPAEVVAALAGLVGAISARFKG